MAVIYNNYYNAYWNVILSIKFKGWLNNIKLTLNFINKILKNV